MRNQDTQQKAIIPPQHTHSNARHYSSKEKTNIFSVVALNKADHNNPLKEIITAVWYMGRSNSASVVYCNLWLRHECWNSGTGKAGGGGYDKNSAALQEAIESAGVQLAKPIDGYGSQASKDALTAIAKAMGYTTILIVEN